MSGRRTADLVYEGRSRFSGTTGSGRTIVFGDEAAANELSPFETIVAALAGCSAMDVISIAGKKRQKVDRYEVHVTGEQRDAYPQVLTEATVVHEVWGRDIEEAAVRRAIELSATRYCPVNAMVSAGATAVHHRYRIHSVPEAGGGTSTSYEAEGEVVTTGPYRRPDPVA